MKKISTEDFSFMEEIFNDTPKDVEVFIDKSMETIDRIHNILKQKKITQKEFARRLGKKESEVSKWLTGVHNFTYKTISKIEVALEDDLIIIIDGEKHNDINKKIQEVYFVDKKNQHSKVRLAIENSNCISDQTQYFFINEFNASNSRFSNCTAHTDFKNSKLDLNVRFTKK